MYKQAQLYGIAFLLLQDYHPYPHYKAIFASCNPYPMKPLSLQHPLRAVHPMPPQTNAGWSTP